MARRKASAFIILLLVTAGCSTSGEKQPEVAVSILPQKYIIDRITGKSVPVMVMIPPGHSPATYAPTSRQIRNLSTCRLYFRIGHIAFEKSRMERLAAVNPAMRIVDTSQGISLLKNETSHETGDHHDHATGVDPHIWLSPGAVKIIARTCLEALSRYRPGEKETFRANYRSLVADITAVEEKIGQNLKAFRGRQFIVFHPAWGYFARDFHLVQVPIELEGKEPGPGHIRRVIDRAKELKIRHIFVQKQFPVHVAEAIAGDINGRVIQLDPLAEDWLGNMHIIADTLKKELEN